MKGEAGSTQLWRGCPSNAQTDRWTDGRGSTHCGHILEASLEFRREKGKRGGLGMDILSVIVKKRKQSVSIHRRTCNRGLEFTREQISDIGCILQCAGKLAL